MKLLVLALAALVGLVGLAALRRSVPSSGASRQHRRLREQASSDGWFADVPRALSLATKPSKSEQLRVLLVSTSLVEYDKGTRGTKRGYDRLQYVVLPQLVDSVTSMTDRGWHVDLYRTWSWATRS